MGEYIGSPLRRVYHFVSVQVLQEFFIVLYQNKLLLRFIMLDILVDTHLTQCNKRTIITPCER